jgi:hypothetical protein
LIVYFEGPPLCGKSTLIRKLCAEYPNAFGCFTSETFGFLPGLSDHEKQVGHFGAHLVMAEIARNNPHKTWLVSRSFYSAAWFAQTYTAREYVREHLIPFWEEKVEGAALLAFLETPWGEVVRRHREVSYEENKGLSLPHVRVYYDAYRCNYAAKTLRVPSLKVSYDWELSRVASLISRDPQLVLNGRREPV